MPYNDGYGGGYGEPPNLTSFVAPTYAERNPDERVHDPKYSMWRHFSPNVTVAQTVIIASGVVIPTAAVGTKTFTVDELAAADAGTGERDLAIFRGRLTHEVSSAEGALLDAAGYTVT